MQKLNLLARVVKPSGLIRRPSQGFPVRWFSTDGNGNEGTEEKEQNQEGEAAATAAAILDPFLQTPSKGLVYGKLIGIGRNTLKTDVIHFFEGCNLTPEDIRTEYNRIYSPLGMILQFPSRTAFDMATRLIVRKNRSYQLGKVDRGQWDLGSTYDGKVALLQGLPRNALHEDVERFLSGCDYEASYTQIFVRQGFPDPIRMALVRFRSQVAAMNACLAKSGGFCLNNPITMRILL